MDPVTSAAALAVISALITHAPEIIADVEKLIAALKSGAAPVALPLPPLEPEMAQAMAAAYVVLLAHAAGKK